MIKTKLIVQTKYDWMSETILENIELLIFLFLPCFRDQYNEILMKKWVQIFQEIFDEDNYTPIMAGSLEEFEAVASKYPFVDDDKLEEVNFFIISGFI